MYTYSSYKKSQVRPFDHLYDGAFKGSKETVLKMNNQALFKTAPVHIISCYYSMFSDTRPCKFAFSQRNGLPIVATTKSCSNVSSSIPHYLRSTPAKNSLPDPFIFSLKPRVTDTPNHKTCQSVYRDMEIQTEPFLSHPKLRNSARCIPEVLLVEDLRTEPGLEEVKKVERDREVRRREHELREMPLSLDEKINQLKVFEWESFLHNEKEINKMQDRRMKYVEKALDIRKTQSEANFREKLMKIYDKSSKEKLKLTQKWNEKAERMFRKLQFGCDLMNEFRLPKIKNQRHLPIEYVPNVEISPIEKFSISFKKELWVPKERPKEFEHTMKSETTLEDLYTTLREFRCREKPKSIRCRKVIPNYDNEVNDDYDTEDQLYQSTVFVQKTIKGMTAQKKLLEGIEKFRDTICIYRKSLPMWQVVDLMGENYMPPFGMPTEEESSDESPCQKDSCEDDEPTDLKEKAAWKFIENILSSYKKENESEAHSSKNCFLELTEDINEILERAKVLVQDIKNRKILNEAHAERLKRKELQSMKGLCQELVKTCEASAVDKTNTFYKEAISKIISILIEAISEKEAIDFIMGRQPELGAITIEQFLNEVVLPHVDIPPKTDDS